ncbi:MAG: DMT family transporter [Rhodospirillaceae bacterium]|nr:DMT family transporter [Rhodospirillaceae bacterium]
MTTRPLLPNWIWLLMLWLVWGSSWPAMRTVFLEVPIWQFRAVTCFIGGVALLGMAWAAGGRLLPARGDWVPLLVASVFNITIWHVAVGYGLSMIAAGHAALVCYTLPVWTALLSAYFLKERLTAKVFASLALGVGGIAVLASQDFTALGDNPLGLAFVFAAAVSWAMGTVLIKRRRWSTGMNALAGWQLLAGTVPIGIIALLIERFTMFEVSDAALLSGGYVILFGIIFGYALWFKVVSLFTATTASIGSLVTPLIGIASSAVLLGEKVGWREVVAATMVLGAVALVVFRPAPPARAA